MCVDLAMVVFLIWKKVFVASGRKRINEIKSRVKKYVVVQMCR